MCRINVHISVTTHKKVDSRIFILLKDQKKKKNWVTEELKDLRGNKLAEKATSHWRQRLVFAVQTVFVENPDFQTESAAPLYNF